MSSNKFTKISKSSITNTTDINNIVTNEDFDIRVTNDISIKDIVDINDNLFFEKVEFNFENNRFVNAMFINKIVDKEYTSFVECKNVYYNKGETCITNKDPKNDAIYYTTEIKTDGNIDEPINEFFVIVDEYLPVGTDILYYIVVNDNLTYQIKPNDDKPLTIQTSQKFSSFKVKAVLRSNGNESPILKSFAVLYYDEYIYRQMGLINPDLGRFTYEDIPLGPEIITLVRDPMNDDKLVEVIGKNETVRLYYNDYSTEKELQTISTHDTETDEKIEESELWYNDYMNSVGAIETVLHQIKTEKFK